MKKFLAAASVAALVIGAASSANAAITMSYTVANQLYDVDSGQILEDFDGVDSALTTYSGNLRGPFDSVYNVSDSAPPPYTGPGSIEACCQDGENYDADPTRYGSVQADQSFTFSTIAGYALTSFSFYIGSPDEYNRLTFNLLDGTSKTFSGHEIWGGPVFNGDRTAGYRVYYDFGGAKVTSISFESIGANAFEFDGLAGSVAAIPEPATWAMMIMGFGAAGTMLRSRRRAFA
ncbi:PEPxxWA-CTERM sorting domain-containing protein [Phenylobacterium sp. SCN 70-31]|uniref:PEPxxWA-CTERM sorting domain-containing protein n=1 Tax=Phenylobacterium sp. SCN 70-31 TaxID=1660129 RepID=UPI000869A656|nr:PEPxxWA-CTERM sorting domain-containing protein [Phenylobacterium sp. SCN 70-31]ODT86163.1 MAG: hypothetical protein ABS78_17735 [Phenylobacterium sp. SCN 70-31]